MPCPRRSATTAWSVVDSRYLELTGHLAEARALLQTASAYQNANFDAPAQQRAWYFFRQGEMAFEAGDNDAALGDEREAVTVFPNYADALRTLARIECALHEWQQCLPMRKRSANIVPYPETLGYEADAQRALGNAAGRRSNRRPDPHRRRLGDAAAHHRPAARDLLFRPRQLYPADAYAIAKNELNARDDIFTEDTLAWAAAMDGRWAKRARTSPKRRALRHAEFADRVSRRRDRAHFGDRAAEKAHLQRALALNPRFHPAFADDARARLAASERAAIKLRCIRVPGHAAW
jgi:tetratricopeptide (TPR) repeat protein